nr:retrovirus-related Pol polyprotein from transposon opus [Tanacetum cinerariifolium]
IDLESWVFAINEYFSLLNTPAEQRLRIVRFNLEGAATEWFRSMSRNGLITTWDRFEESIKNFFGQSKYKDPQGALSKLLQLGMRKLLVSRPASLRDVFALARITKARLEDQTALATGTISKPATSVGTQKPAGKIGKGDVHVLIDNGSTHNFIRPDVVEKICLPIKSTKAFKVYIGSGESLLCESDDSLRMKKISLHQMQAMLENDDVYRVYDVHHLSIETEVEVMRPETAGPRVSLEKSNKNVIGPKNVIGLLVNVSLVIIKRYIDTKPNHELIHYCLKNPPYKLTWPDKEVPIYEGSPVTRNETYKETYKNVSQDIRDQLNVKAEAVQIILTGIDDDIYSTVDACLNACEMWKAIERLKQGESINVQYLETNLYWEFGKFTSHDSESLKSYYSRSQKAATKNRGKAIVNSPQPIYDQEPSMVAEDDETSKDKEIDKLMALISLSFKKIYKPTNNNLQTSLNTSRENQDNSSRINRSTGYENQRIGRECQKPKRVKDAAYHREKMLLFKHEEAGIQLNAEQADWRDDTDDELDDQELKAHYMYMAQL